MVDKGAERTIDGIRQFAVFTDTGIDLLNHLDAVENEDFIVLHRALFGSHFRQTGNYQLKSICHLVKRGQIANGR